MKAIGWLLCRKKSLLQLSRTENMRKSFACSNVNKTCKVMSSKNLTIQTRTLLNWSSWWKRCVLPKKNRWTNRKRSETSRPWSIDSESVFKTWRRNYSPTMGSTWPARCASCSTAMSMSKMRIAFWYRGLWTWKMTKRPRFKRIGSWCSSTRI